MFAPVIARIVEQAPAEAIVSKPLHPYTPTQETLVAGHAVEEGRDQP